MSDQAVALEKQSSAAPASFSAYQVEGWLTRGQKLILELLSSRIASSSPVTKEDIVLTYIAAMSKNGLIRKTVTEAVVINGQYRHLCKNAWVTPDVNGYQERMNSIQWFRSNLGSCILKGRLLAIPVIET